MRIKACSSTSAPVSAPINNSQSRVFLTLNSNAKGSISTALGIKSDRRAGRRKRSSLGSTQEHRYFLRSSAKTAPPAAATSNNSIHTPLSKRYKPLELAKMSREERKHVWEEERAAEENVGGTKAAVGTYASHSSPLLIACHVLTTLHRNLQSRRSKNR